MPIFSLAPAPEALVPFLSDTFRYLGRFACFKPTNNRLQEDAYVRQYLDTQPVGATGDYGVPHFDRACVVRNLAKYNGPSATLSERDMTMLRVARDYVVRMFSPIRANTRIMSYDDVILKTEMDKSPGFPWNRRHATHETVLASHGHDIRDWVQAGLDGATLEPIYWYAFPKEELRTSEKISAGKIRHISGCPTHFKLLANALLLAQNEAFYDMHDHSWSAVGMDVFHGGWHKLACDLDRYPLGLEMDISQMDADFQWAVAQQVKELRWELFPDDMRTPANRKLLNYVYEQIYRGNQVTPDGHVFSKEHGNASGSPLTVVDNTFGTIIAVVFSYIRSCHASGMAPSYDQLIDGLSAKVYGDDNTMTASPALQKILTPDRLVSGFGALGWRITFASDSYGPWQELTFLSRRFHMFDKAGMWVPKPVDGSKYVSSLLLKGSRSGTLASAYVRGCGLLIAAYFDESARRIISGFLDWAELKLRAGAQSDVLRNRLTNMEMVELYTGRGPHTMLAIYGLLDFDD